ncbi:hypothetical protein IM40_09610 (plasmid) [Candidatus Paracaedimonas acanthamoebae]|nr:hypothetical protein IM40_09610 [Candidatus Paracaedimonas acanthamoebae]
MKILAIDGGGVRGIIPAKILENLEARLKKKKHLSECFDIMAGTSTGGIIALMLSKPNASGYPRYRANFIAQLYKTLGENIFDQSIFHFIFSLNGWLDEKYLQENLEKFLYLYLGDTQIKDSLTNVIIPAYDVNTHQTVFFKKYDSQNDPYKNYYMKDVARATSAAPTYFTPAIIKNLNETEIRTLIDGGVAANNPTLSACLHAFEIYGHDNDFLILSLGTGSLYDEATIDSFDSSQFGKGGKLDWAADIVDVVFNAGSDTVHQQMKDLFFYDVHKTKFRRKYYRFQPTLQQHHADMDNGSPENIAALEAYALAVIEQYDTQLEELARFLDE